jgi:single-stranded DNA-binding protein
MSLNKVMLIGSPGHDPEIRYMPESKRSVSLQVVRWLSGAVNECSTQDYKAGSKSFWFKSEFMRSLAPGIEAQIQRRARI